MSKAENLKKIKPKYVPPYIVIRHEQEVIPEFFELPIFLIKEEANPIEKLYAVRSSATSEDGDDKSFAGMFLTKLNVEASDVRDAIKEVRASASNKRVQSYSFFTQFILP